MKKLVIFILSLIIPFSCVRVVKPTKIKVVTTIYPLALIVKEVGGDSVDVQVLIPPGFSPHTFEPTPSTSSALNDAQLFLLVGANLEPWAEQAIKSFLEKKKGKVLVVADGENLIPIPQTETPNPHLWLSPRRIKRFVLKLRDELIGLAPRDSSYFRERSQKTLARLDSLDEVLDRLFSGKKGKGFISVEPAWSYLANDYGLVELGFISSEPSRQPSPQEINRLTDVVKKNKIKTIISQKGIDQKPIAAFAKELKLNIVITDPIGSPHDTLTNTYEKLIMHNANLILSGL